MTPVVKTPAWRWFLPKRVRGFVESTALMCSLVLVGLGLSMQLIGAPRAVELGAAGGTTPITYKTGSFVKQSATGDQDISLPSGLPNMSSLPAGSWAIIFWKTGGAGVSGTWYGQADGHVRSGLGFVANGGGTISQFAAGTFQADNSAPDTSRRMAAACITLPGTSGVGEVYEATFVSFPTSSTMRINWGTNSSGVTEPINYTVITGLTNAKAVSWTAAAAAGSKSVTGVGFSPDLVLHAGLYNPGVIPASATHAQLSFGAMNKHGQQWANGFWSLDAAATSDTSRYQQTDSCFAAVGNAEAVSAQAHFESMGADGFTTYWSTAATDYRMMSLCMGGISSKIGAWSAAAATSDTVGSRHGFEPRGLLFSHTSAVPTGAPSASARWTLGASDLTNERAAALGDNDAVGTTVARAVWDSGEAVIYGGAGTTFTTGGVSATAEDSFTMAWTNTTIGGVEILYLLVGDAGTDTFPSLINGNALDTLAHSTATVHPNQKREATLSTGRQVVVVSKSTPTANFYYHDGAEQGYYSGAAIDGWSNGSIDAYVDSGGTERLVAVWKQSGTGGGRTNDRTYVMVGAFNADRTTLTWGTAVVVHNFVGFDYPDVVAHAEGTGGYAHIVASYNDATPFNAAYRASCPIDSSGAVTSPGYVAFTGAGYGANIPTFPSIDITDDKRLVVAWSAGATGAGKGTRFQTATYSAGPTWTWAASEVTVGTGHYVPNNLQGLTCRWDGTRVVIGGLAFTGAVSKLVVWDSTDFATFTNRADQTLTDAVFIYRPSMAIDSSGHVYLFGSRWDGAYRDMTYYKLTRSGATLTVGSQVVTDSFYGTTVPAGAYAWFYDGKVRWVYTRGNNVPHAVVYDEKEI